MPIKIYPEGKPADETAWLCGGDWSLLSQVAALEAWLGENKARVKSGRYIVDIGFKVRKGAFGGGAGISPEMMRTMADLGMFLYLSEYAPVAKA